MTWAVADAWTVTRRDLAHWARQPGPVAVAWLFPVMVVLMFGTLFGGAIDAPGGNYYDYLMPGMFAMTMLFGLEGTMSAVTTDAARGVTDRFRSLPMHGSAVVLGRCMADLLSSVVGLAVVVATGLALGWRWHEGPAAALAAVGLLLLLRCALLFVGIHLGLLAPGPESVVAVQILVWPVLFLSNAFVDVSTMPGWLATLVEWNPLTATAAAVRDLLGNPGGDPAATASWMGEHALLMAVVWPCVLVAIFLPLATRRFRALSR
jgi:ABC-2 type transport system permease protein